MQTIGSKTSEASKCFETVVITDWKQIYDLEPEGGCWIYRGHGTKHWALEASLVRKSLESDTKDSLINAEHWVDGRRKQSPSLRRSICSNARALQVAAH
jgi:hypothetical protein